MSKQQAALRWGACVSAVVAMGMSIESARADQAQATFAEPPRLQAQQDAVKAGTVKALRAGTNLFSAGAESTAIKAGREIHYVLPIKYTEGLINNPATNKLDRVKLRSYGERFVAPTIVMKPGQTVRIGLQNKLPPEPDCAKDHGTNDPHCFNTTNLHSHGLWVSPTGNSDNVLLSLNPGVDFEYEYNVPEDHPAGTFWYHPHKHGSTAMQVGSGMAGVLVVKGDRAPTPYSNGDLDVLLKPFEPVGGDYAEVMLFQQIPYACFDAKDEIQKNALGQWVCNEGQVAEVKQFKTQMAFGSWGKSGRYTSINGVVRPQIGMQAGRVYRWRTVHSGVREAIALRIRKIGDSKLLTPTAASIEERADEVAKACTGADVSLFEVAADGLTRAQIFQKTATNLQPGYRSDILFTLPEEGAYCVYDDAVPADQSVSAEPENRKVLAIVVARGGKPVKDQKAFLIEQLMASANSLPEDVRGAVKVDLRNMLLTRFVPHPEITQAEIDKSALPVVPIEFNVGGTPTVFQVNGQEYKPERIDHTLILGKAQAWRLSSASASHPFHIHVNPFQIVSVRKKGPDGQATGPEISDGQYTGMLGTWKDTILVQPDVVIETRTRYQRYIGEFVLHCHILDHEDQGMMQNVQIVLSDGKGGAQLKGHH